MSLTGAPASIHAAAGLRTNHELVPKPTPIDPNLA
jgi:hypothetical protein